MNEASSQNIVDGFLRGGFDVFEALLGMGFTFDAESSSDAGEGDLAKALSEHTICLQAKVAGGGEVAMLLRPQDASKILSIQSTGEAEESDSLDDEQLGTLREVSNGALGGGASNLTERFGESYEVESSDAVARKAGDVAGLTEFIGEGPVLTSFTFSADPHFDSTGYLVHSAALESRVPEEARDQESLVSDDEMKDILSGFSPDQETGSYAGSDRGVPQNLDVILGISLNATARLGKVEMPISEVLNIGPGSIIEVGKMVDDPVELLVNGKLIARGDVVVVDEKFGLRITEIISPQKRIESLG